MDFSPVWTARTLRLFEELQQQGLLVGVGLCLLEELQQQGLQANVVPSILVGEGLCNSWRRAAAGTPG